MNKLIVVTLGLAALFLNACKKGESAQETITTMEVHFTGINSNFEQKYYWNDTDGDGGNAPTIDTIKLPPNSSFTAHLHLYDRNQTPELDVTDEVESENTEHVFTYVFSNLNGQLVATGFDSDDNGAPLRLTSTWATSGKGNGSVTITLYHEPTDKNNATDPGGEVDFVAEFPIVIQ